MLSGMYYVEFRANNNDFGQGLVCIEDGKVNGGDHAFIFQGRMDAYNGEVQAVIEVKHYKGEPLSVFGPLRQFTLNLSGKTDGVSFNLDGGIANMPGAAINIRGNKVADLYK